MNRPFHRLILLGLREKLLLSRSPKVRRRFETWEGQRYDEDFLRPFRKSGHNFMRFGVIERIVTNLDTLTAVQKRKIPQGYLSAFADDVVGQSYLRWLMQKDSLRQDTLLAVTGGAGIIQCRRLAMAYAELVQRPVDLLTITSNTTVHDILQRRIFVDQSDGKDTNSLRYRGYIWEDQAAVRAALGGHFLILDGLHRAERNVVAALHSLLANRELYLEDGRTLISREVYLTFKEEGWTKRNLQIIPISDEFRVIALWSHSLDRLDPETRSRFQICRVDTPPCGLLYEKLLWNHDDDNDPKVKQLEEKTRDSVSLSIPIPDDSRNFEIPDISREKSAEQLSLLASVLTNSTVIKNDGFYFPLTSLWAMHRIRKHFPQTPLSELLYRAFPYSSPEPRLRKVLDHWPMAVATRNLVQYFLEDMGLMEAENVSPPNTKVNAYTFQLVKAIPGDPYNVHVYWSQRKMFNKQGIFASMFKDYSLGDVRVKVASGGRFSSSVSPLANITNGATNNILTALLQEHFAGRDILLVAPHGDEKNALANLFCSLTGYEALTFPLHEEMSPMDLLWQKSTPSGTGVTESPLLKAASSGQVCILDGIEKVSSDVMATLQGFLTDRQIVFSDGLKYTLSLSDGDLGHKVQRIHPSFRVIALATIPTPGIENTTGMPSPPKWLSEEVVSIFATVSLPAPIQDV